MNLPYQKIPEKNRRAVRLKISRSWNADKALKTMVFCKIQWISRRLCGSVVAKESDRMEAPYGKTKMYKNR